VFLGSSGVGKSTLINALAGEELQATAAIRESDDRGRHTTIRRELLVLPDGGIVIDTPGMRELQLWESEDGMDTAFSDIAELMTQCRFSDCSHEQEPGCAVRAALAAGSLDRERWDSYKRLQREVRALEIKLDKRLQADERKKRRAFARQQRRPKEW
jgi:ribosome biogenesis GTPase